MKGYQTKQKRDVVAFLQQNIHTPKSIEDMIEGMGNAVGKSTVYRLVNRLVEEGKVVRFVQGNSRHFVYQLKEREDCHSHVHCRCTVCGQLLHLDSGASGAMAQLVSLGGFALDAGKTTLLGTCGGCRQKEAL